MNDKQPSLVILPSYSKSQQKTTSPFFLSTKNKQNFQVRRTKFINLPKASIFPFKMNTNTFVSGPTKEKEYAKS